MRKKGKKKYVEMPQVSISYTPGAIAGIKLGNSIEKFLLSLSLCKLFQLQICQLQWGKQIFAHIVVAHSNRQR